MRREQSFDVGDGLLLNSERALLLFLVVGSVEAVRGLLSGGDPACYGVEWWLWRRRRVDGYVCGVVEAARCASSLLLPARPAATRAAR